MNFFKGARSVGLGELWLLVFLLTLSAVPLTASREFPALADKSLQARAETREIHDEVDPTEQQSCYSMGQINITYESGEVGPPGVGLRVTDPRGRKIGYDLGANKGWQELPVAQAFFDCDENEDTGELRHCAGHVQICGPISGTYQVEVLPTHSGRYSISASGRSQDIRDERSLHSTGSQVELKSEMWEQKPATLLLQYSREAGVQIKLTRSGQRIAHREMGFTGKPSR